VEVVGGGGGVWGCGGGGGVGGGGGGPCTFAPFRRRRQSKTNCHSRKSISHYSSWNFRSKTKSGSQSFIIRFGTSASKTKCGSRSCTFVLEHVVTKSKSQVDFLLCFGTVAPKWKCESRNSTIPLFIFRRNGIGWTSHTIWEKESTSSHHLGEVTETD